MLFIIKGFQHGGGSSSSGCGRAFTTSLIRTLKKGWTAIKAEVQSTTK